MIRFVSPVVVVRASGPEDCVTPPGNASWCPTLRSSTLSGSVPGRWMKPTNGDVSVTVARRPGLKVTAENPPDNGEDLHASRPKSTSGLVSGVDGPQRCGLEGPWRGALGS